MSRNLRVGINGFGQMGRLALRADWGEEGVDQVIEATGKFRRPDLMPPTSTGALGASWSPHQSWRRL